ncbi:MAG: hypothetical protein LAO04_22580, partial [Acidobacteriia bacterium]|nr:hypothetical protein [Terriglobia bacterium]
MPGVKWVGFQNVYDVENRPVFVLIVEFVERGNLPAKGRSSITPASYIEAQSERIWRETVWHVIAQVLLIVLVTILIIRWSIVLPIS